MKAIVWTAYGPPESLQLREVETPVPKDDEVRIRVRATTVSAGEFDLVGQRLPPLFRLIFRFYVGIDRPRRMTILGQELAGEVESVGSAVTGFKPGDAVFGTPFLRMGGYGEYACLRPNGNLAVVPPEVTYEQAATLPVGGIEALHHLRQADLKPREKILIVGAGGCIGTYAVQLAVQRGAEVTAVDSAPKLDMLRSLGAAHVVDFTREPVPPAAARYDAAFDVIGKGPFQAIVRSLKPGGRFVVGNPQGVHRRGVGWAERTAGVRVHTKTAGYTEKDLDHAAGLVAAGELRPVIDRIFPLERTADAYRYVGTGEKKGHIVISVA